MRGFLFLKRDGVRFSQNIEWRRWNFRFSLRRMFAEAGEDRFKRRQHAPCAFGANNPIPQRLEFLPAARITDVTQPPEEVFFSPSAFKDRSPAIEITIGAPVTSLQILRRHFSRAEDDVASIEYIPVITSHALLGDHSLI